MEPDPVLRVTVVHAWPGRAPLIEVEVPAGSTLRDAIAAAGVLSHVELDSDSLTVGVFNQIRSIDSIARDGDRVEIYRPLTIDPKESRRLRAAIRRKKKAA